MTITVLISGNAKGTYVYLWQAAPISPSPLGSGLLLTYWMIPGKQLQQQTILFADTSVPQC